VFGLSALGHFLENKALGMLMMSFALACLFIGKWTATAEFESFRHRVSVDPHLKFYLPLLGIVPSFLGILMLGTNPVASAIFLAIGSLCLYELPAVKSWISRQKRAAQQKSSVQSPPKTTLAVSQTIGGDIQNTKVLEHIRNIIGQEEEILALLRGAGENTNIGGLFGKKAGAALGGAYLVVTNKKLVVIKSGVGSWTTGAFGMKTKTYLYEHIASVDVSRGLLFGEIEIVSAGMVEKSSGGFFEGAEKDSVVQFENEYFDDVQRLAATIQDIARDRHHGRGAGSTPNIVEQIKVLADLKDREVLSATEFEEKKQKLLSRI
jgi:hypothetical protein